MRPVPPERALRCQAPGRETSLSRQNETLAVAGEQAAARHLEGLGFGIVERRLRTPYGEIDLIAVGAGRVIFVEVKTRSSDRFGAPALAVDRRRAERLRNSALHLLSSRAEWRGLKPRIDVLEVLWRAGMVSEIRHIKDAVGA